MGMKCARGSQVAGMARIGQDNFPSVREQLAEQFCLLNGHNVIIAAPDGQRRERVAPELLFIGGNPHWRDRDKAGQFVRVAYYQGKAVVPPR